jgi:hypothetical protein
VVEQPPVFFNVVESDEPVNYKRLEDGSIERVEPDAPLTCPECGEPVWDGPKGHKLAKCWNTEGHADGGTLAFDTVAD